MLLIYLTLIICIYNVYFISSSIIHTFKIQLKSSSIICYKNEENSDGDQNDFPSTVLAIPRTIQRFKLADHRLVPTTYNAACVTVQNGKCMFVKYTSVISPNER